MIWLFLPLLAVFPGISLFPGVVSQSPGSVSCCFPVPRQCFPVFPSSQAVFPGISQRFPAPEPRQHSQGDDVGVGRGHGDAQRVLPVPIHCVLVGPALQEQAHLAVRGTKGPQGRNSSSRGTESPPESAPHCPHSVQITAGTLRD